MSNQQQRMKELQERYSAAGTTARHKIDNCDYSLTRVHAGLYLLFTGSEFVEFECSVVDSGRVEWRTRTRTSMALDARTEWRQTYSTLRDARQAEIDNLKQEHLLASN